MNLARSSIRFVSDSSSFSPACLKEITSQLPTKESRSSARRFVCLDSFQYTVWLDNTVVVLQPHEDGKRELCWLEDTEKVLLVPSSFLYDAKTALAKCGSAQQFCKLEKRKHEDLFYASSNSPKQNESEVARGSFAHKQHILLNRNGSPPEPSLVVFGCGENAARAGNDDRKESSNYDEVPQPQLQEEIENWKKQIDGMSHEERTRNRRYLDLNKYGEHRFMKESVIVTDDQVGSNQVKLCNQLRVCFVEKDGLYFALPAADDVLFTQDEFRELYQDENSETKITWVSFQEVLEKAEIGTLVEPSKEGKTKRGAAGANDRTAGTTRGEIESKKSAPANTEPSTGSSTKAKSTQAESVTTRLPTDITTKRSMRGLVNPGDAYVCYANASVQLLAPFLAAVLSTHELDDENHPVTSRTMAVVRRLMDAGGGRSPIDGRGILDAIHQIDSSKLVAKRHHDALEFITYLLSRIEEEIGPDVVQQFRGEVEVESVCNDCQCRKRQNAPCDWYLTAQVKGHLIETSELVLRNLSNNTTGACTNCRDTGQQADWEEKTGIDHTKIKSGPIYCLVLLDRLGLTKEEKPQNKVLISETMKLPVEGDGRKQWLVYDLIGVSMHTGTTMMEGHNYAFVRNGSEWYRYDDRKVRKANWEKDIRNSPTSQEDAYILLYKKRQNDA